jgi:hypothetical protein
VAIEQIKTSSSRVVKTFTGKYVEEYRPFLVRCDFCGRDAHKPGDTPGDAADAARKDGYTTIPAKIPALPSKWSCRSCKENK